MRTGRYVIETMVSSMKRGFCSSFGVDDAYELGKKNSINSLILRNLGTVGSGSVIF